MSELVHKLAGITRMSVSDVRGVIATAPRRYKVYPIKKRDGTDRIIAHPARELKAIQRALVLESPASLGVHSAATAYEKGSSIAVNAERHVKNVWVAKFDLRNFFNSIDVSAWQGFLSSLEVDEEYISISSKVFFWKPPRRKANLCLSVGAPSSPFASNRFMYQFDCSVEKFCNTAGYSYTRYADDITVSSKSQIDGSAVKNHLLLALEGTPLTLKDDKTIMLGPGQRRVVTGIVLRNDGQISLGRQRKREIEAMVYNFSKGTAKSTLNQIRGHLALLKMVDPKGYARLREKYSQCEKLFKTE
jgi:RNA-directed DNA polymerase